MRELDLSEHQALLELLAQHPELTVARVRELVESPGTGRRRPRPEAIRPRTSADVVALLQAKVITRAEARSYLRLR